MGRHNQQSVDAIVRLFGALCYIVSLTGPYQGADFYSTLYYDAQRGREDQILVLNEQAEFLQVEEITTSNQTVRDDKVSAGSVFLRFLARSMNAELVE